MLHIAVPDRVGGGQNGLTVSSKSAVNTLKCARGLTVVDM